MTSSPTRNLLAVTFGLYKVYEENQKRVAPADQFDSRSDASSFGPIIKREKRYVPQVEGSDGTIASQP